ncbi:major facilitator superfamily domain-containing protein [Hypomontagnella submonticulosa]|nr:major facilitator superfamily domain-containing protein [Hypomontagnella submonticulosa]
MSTLDEPKPCRQPSAVESQNEGSDPEAGSEENQLQGQYGWDGDNDPDNPQNWSYLKKAINIGIVFVLAFITPLSSSTVGPALPLLAEDLGETREHVVALVVSIFVLGFAFGPLVLAPLSELYGRRPIYNISNIVSLACSIGCALAPNMASLVVFRFVAGCFGAAPMTVAGGSIADLVPLAHRGIVMAGLFAGIFLGPVIGPVIGGFVAEMVGWRWIFWLIVIVSTIATILTLCFLNESHADTILRKKAELSKEQSQLDGKSSAKVQAVLLQSILRPMRMLIRSPIITGLSLYLALIYGYLYLLFATFSTVFPKQYGFGPGILGLAYLGLGAGMAIALAILSWFSDWSQERLTRKYGRSKPEYRLLPLIFGIPFIPIGLFGYGWTTQYQVHWIVPIIFTSFAGIGLIFSFVPTQIYMVDAFTKYAASALAAASAVRSIFGGCLPIAGLPMYSALGYGWGNSLLGFAALAASVAPFVFWRYGERLRTKYQVSFD